MCGVEPTLANFPMLIHSIPVRSATTEARLDFPTPGVPVINIFGRSRDILIHTWLRRNTRRLIYLKAIENLINIYLFATFALLLLPSLGHSEGFLLVFSSLLQDLFRSFDLELWSPLARLDGILCLLDGGMVGRESTGPVLVALVVGPALLGELTSLLPLLVPSKTK